MPLRHPWRYLSGLVVLVALGLVIWSLFTNPNLDVATIGHYLFEPYIIKGVGVTLMLTVVSMVLGVALSVLLAVMRLSENRVLSGVAWLYIWFFRGTPLLVQIIFWGFLGALYPRVVIGIPFTDITFYEQVTSVLIPATVAAIIALTLNEAAYNAEIVRAGLISVDVGQSEAAAALGLSGRQAMRTIVLPQAMRVIVPPLGNQTISMLKATSLVAIVGGQELLTAVQSIYSNNFKVMPLLAVAAIWYLALVSVLSVGQHFLERRYGKAGVAPARPGLLRRLFVSEGGPA
ncbi:amino acid ABC transporter permease [Nonomuraea spiralis]|uniref:Amino acid ABC transporter permease n=1 Tax=Nonomuraea spiralis TaxID=46182 RepID=A0ABV5ITK8_9ACTN|nr:amino acid ABC transporter permease [Nonomuraea spiralis]GGT17355.1 polar amino acid ABC transporter permease [Nonomuraea spiralis]